ncbi:Flp pilus assembly complex ATPase component TadA [Candidatus Micrarchaeota archaeon]|nr:Flp pilus assembly complex ATPase component TadA [Candidatus Micrarchaeota archaeon]
MDVLGWQILKNGEYEIDLPILSKDEEELIIATEERFKEATRREESELLVEKILLKTAEESGIYLNMNQQDYLCRIATMHICGFAFMENLIQDHEIEEISVIGPGKPIYVYLRKKGWKTVNACFENEKAIADMINKMGRSLGRHITMQNPRLDAALADGSRLHASLPPISQGEITIRKFRDIPFSPKELVLNDTISLDSLAVLSILMQCDCSIIIGGNTASGKTTTLNALFSFVPANERVIITEETPEINIPHEHQLRLIANKEMGIHLKDLVYDSLRMRPDRMIVGEVRNKEEAEALFDVLLAGQARGSYATLHAQSVDEAVSRLRSFGINENDVKCIDCIVIQRRMLLYDSKKRKNVEIRKIIEIRELGKTALMEQAAESFGLNKQEMEEELKKRKKLITKAGLEYMEFYSHVQEQLFGG